jgi:hypothetical protein
MEESNEVSRRSFLKKSTGVAAGASAFTIIKPELVRGAGNEKLKAGLVGCGQRGTGAASQLLHGNENVELVAMGDIFEDHLEASLNNIRNSTKYPGVMARESAYSGQKMGPDDSVAIGSVSEGVRLRSADACAAAAGAGGL